MTKEQEMELIRKILSGNTNEFESLVLEHQKNVYNLALRMVGNPDDALDMAQEAFLKAYNSLGSFRGDSKFSVWLYRLTSNICIDFLRKSSRQQTLPLTFINGEDDVQEIEISDIRFAPETELEKKEFQEAIWSGLSALPEEYRRILILREINGMSYDEISQAVGIESGTVKSRLFRARKRLCAALTDSGNFSLPSPSKDERRCEANADLQ